MADRGWKALHSSSHLLTERWQAEDYRNHKQRIAEMQPMTDTSEPMAWRLRALRSVSPKAAWFRQVKATEVMRENQRLVESITRISNADHTLENSPQGGPVHGRQLFRSAFNVAGPGYRLGPNQVPVLDTSMPHSPGTLKGKAERVAADYIAETNISMYKRLMEASSRVSPDELDNKLRELEAFAAPHNAFDHTLRHYRPPAALQNMPHLTQSMDGLALTSLGARAAGTRAHAASTHLTTSLWTDEGGVFDLKGMAASTTPPQTLKPYMSGPGRVVPSKMRPITAPVGDEGEEEEEEGDTEGGHQQQEQQGVQEEPSSGHLPPLAGAGHQQHPHPRTAWDVVDSKTAAYGLQASGGRASTSPAKARMGKGKGTKGRFSRLPAHAYMKGTNAQSGVPGSTVTTLALVSSPLPDGSTLGQGQEGSPATAGGGGVMGEEASVAEVYGTSLPETGEQFSLRPLRNAWGRTSGPHPTALGDTAGGDQGSGSTPSTPLARLAAERGFNLAELLRSASPPPTAPAGLRSLGWLNGAATMPPVTSISAGSPTGRLSGHSTERWLHTIPLHPVKGRLPPATVAVTGQAKGRASGIAGSKAAAPAGEASGDEVAEGRTSPLLKPLDLHSSSPPKQRHAAAVHTSPTRVIALHKPEEQSHQQSGSKSQGSSRRGPRAPAAALAARSLEDSDLEAAFHHEDLPVDEGYVEPREGHEAPKSQAGHRAHPPRKPPAPSAATPQASRAQQQPGQANEQEVLRRKPQQAPNLPGPAVEQEDSVESAPLTADTYEDQFDTEQAGQYQEQPPQPQEEGVEAADAQPYAAGGEEEEAPPPEEEEGSAGPWSQAPAAQRVSEGADEVAEEGYEEEAGDRPTAEVPETVAEPDVDAEGEGGDRPTEERYTWASEDQQQAEQAQVTPTPPPAAAAQLEDEEQQPTQEPAEGGDDGVEEGDSEWQAPAEGLGYGGAQPEDQPREFTEAPGTSGDLPQQQGQDAAEEQAQELQQDPEHSAQQGAAGASGGEGEEGQEEEEEGYGDVGSEFSTMVEPGKYMDADDEDRYTVDAFSGDGRDPLASQGGNQQQQATHGSTGGGSSPAAADAEAATALESAGGTATEASAGAGGGEPVAMGEQPREGSGLATIDEGQQEAGMAEGAVELDSAEEASDPLLMPADQPEEEEPSLAAIRDVDDQGGTDAQARSQHSELAVGEEGEGQEQEALEGGDLRTDPAVLEQEQEYAGEAAAVLLPDTAGVEPSTEQVDSGQPEDAESGAPHATLPVETEQQAAGDAAEAGQELQQEGHAPVDEGNMQAVSDDAEYSAEPTTAGEADQQQLEGQQATSETDPAPSQQQASAAADGNPAAEQEASGTPGSLPPTMPPSLVPERTASTASAALPLLDGRASVGSGASGSVRARRRRASWVDMEHLQDVPSPHVDPDMAMPVNLIAAAQADPALTRRASSEAQQNLLGSQGSGGPSRLGMVRSDSLGRAVPSSAGFLQDQLAAQQAIVMRKKERTRSRLQMDSRTSSLSPQGSGVPFPPPSSLGPSAHGQSGVPPGAAFPPGMSMDAAMLEAIYEEAAAGEGGGMRGGDITMSRRSHGSHLHGDGLDSVTEEEGGAERGGAQSQLQSVPMLQDHAPHGSGDLGGAGDSAAGSAAGSGRKGRGRRTSWIDLEQPTPDEGATYNLMAAANTDALLGGRLAAVGPTNAAQVQEQIAAQHALLSRKKERKKSRLQLESRSTDQFPGMDMGMDGSMQSAPWPANEQTAGAGQQQGMQDAPLTGPEGGAPAMQQTGSMGAAGPSRSRFATASSSSPAGHGASRFAQSSFGVSGGSGVLMASVVDQEGGEGMMAQEEEGGQQGDAQEPGPAGDGGVGSTMQEQQPPEQQQLQDVLVAEAAEQQQEKQEGADAGDVGDLPGSHAEAAAEGPTQQPGEPGDTDTTAAGSDLAADARDMASPWRLAQAAEGEEDSNQPAEAATLGNQQPEQQQQQQASTGEAADGAVEEDAGEGQVVSMQGSTAHDAEQQQLTELEGSPTTDAPATASADVPEQQPPPPQIEAEQSGTATDTAGPAPSSSHSKEQHSSQEHGEDDEGAEDDDSVEQHELLGGDVLGVGDLTPRAVQEEHSIAHLDSQQLSGFEDILGETSAEQTPVMETPRSDAAVGAYRPAAGRGGAGGAAQRYGPAVLEQSGAEGEMDPPSHTASSQALSGFEDALEDGQFIDDHR